jgi:hypothetical protein
MSTKYKKTLRRRQLGSELRSLRQAAGLTIKQAAEQIDCSTAKLSRIETTRVGAKVTDVHALVSLYGANAEKRDALLQLAEVARQRNTWWWHPYSNAPDLWTYIGWEDRATRICEFEALIVPGLLQTEAYGRTIIATALPQLCPDEVESRLEFRTARQARLTEGTLVFSSVIDEAVLRRVVCSPEIMREQLELLVETAALPNVTLHVLPFTEGRHVGMTGAFTICWFPESTDAEVVFVELNGGNLFLEGAEEIQKNTARFDHLRSTALAPDDSAAFIGRLASELYELRTTAAREGRTRRHGLPGGKPPTQGA